MAAALSTAVGCSGQPTPTAPVASFAPTSASTLVALPGATATPAATATLAASPSPAPPATSDGVAVLPGPGTELEPGRYRNETFEPAFSFEIGEGWTAKQSASGFFDIQDDPGSLDVVAVQFATVEGDSAQVVVDSILERENLVVSEPVPVVIGGREGIRVVVETSDPADTTPPVFRTVMNLEPGPLGIASARRLEANLLDVDGTVLAILVGGSIAEWDRAQELAAPVLQSVTFD